MSNLELWNSVEKTNPAHTKKVQFGRAITAIDPYHQIKSATEKFGAAGDGWGWSVVQTEFLPTNQVACLVRLWHGNQESFIEHWGQNGLYTDKKMEKIDTDCMKKAVTDGVTKCLSCLGFNADVFLGKFDDNKYIAQMNSEFAGKIGDKILECNSIAELTSLWNTMSKAEQDKNKAVFSARKEELS